MSNIYANPDAGQEVARHKDDIKKTKARLNAIMGPIVEQAAMQAAGQLASDTYRHPNNPSSMLIEQGVQHKTVSSQMRPYTGQWNVVQVLKESANGKETERWRIHGPNNFKYPNEYRHSIVASTVAAILNETGGRIDDPRLAKLENLVMQEKSLMREVRQHKDAFKTVPSGNVTKREILETKGREAVRKLKETRSMLGVL